MDILSFSRALEDFKTSWLCTSTKIYRQIIERRTLTLPLVKGLTKSADIEVHVEKAGYPRSTQRYIYIKDASFKIVQCEQDAVCALVFSIPVAFLQIIQLRQESLDGVSAYHNVSTVTG